MKKPQFKVGDIIKKIFPDKSELKYKVFAKHNIYYELENLTFPHFENILREFTIVEKEYRPLTKLELAMK